MYLGRPRNPSRDKGPLGNFVVYFLQLTSDSPIKIGKTDRFKRRYAVYCVHSPWRPIVLGIWHCESSHEMNALERDLHFTFDHLRTNGEWFKPAEALLELIGLVRCGEIGEIYDRGLLRYKDIWDPEILKRI